MHERIDRNMVSTIVCDILTSDGDEGLATGDLRQAIGDLPRGLRLCSVDCKS